MEGKPKQVKWLKAGSPVDDKVAKVKDLGGGKYELVIDEMKAEDFGQYSVQISNDAGTSESKATIAVKSGKWELFGVIDYRLADELVLYEFY